MPYRQAKVIDTRGVEYEGSLMRRGNRQFAVFCEPANEEYPDGEYVVHRFIPHIFAWLPIRSFLSEAEAVKHLNDLFDTVEATGLEAPTRRIAADPE